MVMKNLVYLEHYGYEKQTVKPDRVIPKGYKASLNVTVFDWKHKKAMTPLAAVHKY